jgi:hypothetical protein
MWVWEKVVPNHELPKNISLQAQGLNSETCAYELEDHVGEKKLNSNSPTKFKLAKKTFLASFPSCLLKNT